MVSNFILRYIDIRYKFELLTKIKISQIIKIFTGFGVNLIVKYLRCVENGKEL